MKKDICDWLLDFLRDGPKDVNEVRVAAKVAGYTRDELRGAKRICGIRTTNNRTKDHQVTSRWFWGLPEIEP